MWPLCIWVSVNDASAGARPKVRDADSDQRSRAVRCAGHCRIGRRVIARNHGGHRDESIGFSPSDTEARARRWLTEGTYTITGLSRTGLLWDSWHCLNAEHSMPEGPFGTIPELYVRPAFRSSQVGATLVAEAKQVAHSRGWTRLEVTTPPLPQFDRTLAFYERQGFSISGGRKMKLALP